MGHFSEQEKEIIMLMRENAEFRAIILQFIYKTTGGECCE